MRFLHALLHPGGSGPFPTVLALHGHGAHGLDLIGFSQFLPSGVLWLCPQAEFEVQPGAPSFTWFHFDRGDPRRDEEVERVVEGLRSFLDEALERYPIDSERVALLGFSQGGMIGYRMALSEPERFAGLAALSTTLSAESVERLSPGEALSRLPVLVQHGTQDPMIGVERAQESRDRLEALGVDLEYHEYEMGHQVGNESASDLSVWLTNVLNLADGEPGSDESSDGSTGSP